MDLPNNCPNNPAAIGERTAFMPQANKTACGFAGRSDAAMEVYPFQCSTQIRVNSRRAVS